MDVAFLQCEWVEGLVSTRLPGRCTPLSMVALNTVSPLVPQLPKHIPKTVHIGLAVVDSVFKDFRG